MAKVTGICFGRAAYLYTTQIEFGLDRMLVGVLLAIRSFDMRYSFSFSMIVKPRVSNVVISTIKNAAVETDCQIVEYATSSKKFVSTGACVCFLHTKTIN
jgi:hypothetical protein